ncbi:Translation initiation factor IF3-4, chloroplastic [Linum perenne]
MAGLTCAGAFPFTPVRTAGKSTNLLPSFDSNLFGLRFHISTRESLLYSPSSRKFTGSSLIVASRYGGNNRAPQNEPDDEQALDISSVRSATVRLIDEDQNMVGVVSKNEAIQMAEAAELDLLSADADPPVLRIMDYNKYRYELLKKKKDQQKKSAGESLFYIKELKMGYAIDQHDYDVRMRAAKKFLKEGDKVKVIVQMKGRQNDFRNNAIALIRRFQNDVGELATEENKNFRDRNIFITLAPNKALQLKSLEPPKTKDDESPAANEVSASADESPAANEVSASA